MALMQVTVKSITGRTLTGTTQSIVVNAEHVFDWEDFGSDSRFRYVLNLWDRREKALLVTIDEALSAKISSANTAFGDVICKLPVEATVGGSTTDRYIPVRSIAWAEAVASQTDHVYVTYNEGGFKNVTVMVPFSLNDMVYVGSTGTSSS
jgi:hypothetical protein